MVVALGSQQGEQYGYRRQDRKQDRRTDGQSQGSRWRGQRRSGPAGRRPSRPDQGQPQAGRREDQRRLQRLTPGNASWLARGSSQPHPRLAPDRTCDLFCVSRASQAALRADGGTRASRVVRLTPARLSRGSSRSLVSDAFRGSGCPWRVAPRTKETTARLSVLTAAAPLSVRVVSGSVRSEAMAGACWWM